MVLYALLNRPTKIQIGYSYWASKSVRWKAMGCYGFNHWKTFGPFSKTWIIITISSLWKINSRD